MSQDKWTLMSVPAAGVTARPVAELLGYWPHARRKARSGRAMGLTSAVPEQRHYGNQGKITSEVTGWL